MAKETKPFVIGFTMIVGDEDGEGYMELRPDAIWTAGLTPKEAGQLAEGWAQSDIYTVDIVHDIIEALDQRSKQPEEVDDDG